MTLENTLLQKVPDWRPAPHERATLTVASDDGVWNARLTVDRCEELSAALWELRLDRGSKSLALSLDQLGSWAKAVVQVSGVIDSLAIVELDRSRGRAQLRSAAPAERDGQRSYFEILLSKNGQADVRRYRAGQTDREQVLFVLTHENLARLAGHLTETVTDEKQPV